MRSRGQVVVEVLLILPVFLMIVFTIMEIGHLAFRAILLHHAAYEVARFGSLTSEAKADLGCSRPRPREAEMRRLATRILPTVRMDVEMVQVAYGTDPQSGCQNFDLKVTLRQSVPMIFPLTGLFLADRGARGRTLVATVPMPIERPLFK